MTDGGQTPGEDRDQPTQLGQPPDRPSQYRNRRPPPKANLRPAISSEPRPDETQLFRPDEINETAERLGVASTTDYEPAAPIGRDPHSDTELQPRSWAPSPTPNPPPPPAASPTFRRFDDGGPGNTTQIGGPPENAAPRRGPAPGSTPKLPPGPPSLPASTPTPPQPDSSSRIDLDPGADPDPLEREPSALMPPAQMSEPLLQAPPAASGPETLEQAPILIPPPENLLPENPAPEASIPQVPQVPQQSSAPILPPPMPSPQPPQGAQPMPSPQPPQPLPPQQMAPLGEMPPSPGNEPAAELSSPAIGEPSTVKKEGLFNADYLADGSLLLPMIALAGSLVAMSIVGIANYFERSGSAFWSNLTGFWPALLIASTVALAIATTEISERARNGFIVAAVLTILTTGISYLQLIWNVLFGNNGAQFRDLFQTLVGNTGQTIALCAVAAGAAFLASSDRDKAQKIISLGLVAIPVLGVLSTPRLWGSLPPLGFMDQVATLFAGFNVGVGTGLLVAAIANILRPIDNRLRLLIAAVAGGTIGFTLLYDLALSLGDGQARFVSTGDGNSRVTIFVCALAIILSLLNSQPSSVEHSSAD